MLGLVPSLGHNGQPALNREAVFEALFRLAESSRPGVPQVGLHGFEARSI